MNYAEIEVLRDIVHEELNVSTRTGIVDKVADNYVNVRIGHATVLKRLAVIGDISYLQAGSNVLLLTVGSTSYVLSSGVFSGSGSRDSGSYYSLGSLYYDKTEVNDLLSRKADAGHSHRYDHLEAITGIIGGFEVTSDTIRSSVGNFALTSNANATRMVMGSNDDVAVMDGKHATYRFWAGKADPSTAPFSVTKAGAIHATSGNIAGWDITATELSKNNVEIDPLGRFVVAPGDTSEDYAVFGRVELDDSPTSWRLWIGHSDPALAPFRVNKYGEAWLESATIDITLESDNYETGVRGWKIDSSGWAEFQDITVRGRIEASVFAETTISGVSGQMLISIGDVLIADVEATSTTIDVAAGVFGANDIIHFRPSGKEEWMRITTDAIPISGGFRYGVERDYSNSGSEAFESGTACLRKGSSGDARTPQELAAAAAEGAFGALQPGGGGGASAGGWLVLDGSSSSFSVITRQGPVWNQYATTVRIGNLSGFLDYSAEIYGFAIGDENDYMSYDATNGLRIQFLGSAYDTTVSGAGFQTELITLSEISAPGTGVPEANHAIVYLDSSDNSVKVRMDDATEFTIEGSAWTDLGSDYIGPSDTDYNILIGTTTPFDQGGMPSKFAVYNDQSGTYRYIITGEGDQANAIMAMTSYHATGGSSFGAGYLGRFARGSRASPSAVQSGDRLGFFLYGGYDGNSWENPAGLEIFAADSWGDSQRGAYWKLAATPAGSTTRTTIVYIYGDRFQSEMPVYIKEQAVASADIAAYAQIWVYNSTPNQLYWTDDAGNDHKIGSADILEIQVFS